MIRNLLIALLFSVAAWAQDCSPYHRVLDWEPNEEVEFTVAWVHCFHAAGISATTGWKAWSVGTHIMGAGHHNTAYAFLDWTYTEKRVKFFMGPAMRLNNNPTPILGRAGVDIGLTKQIWFTTTILQANFNVNYLNLGIKLRI